jgi:hypothetical protein
MMFTRFCLRGGTLGIANQVERPITNLVELGRRRHKYKGEAQNNMKTGEVMLTVGSTALSGDVGCAGDEEKGEERLRP